MWSCDHTVSRWAKTASQAPTSHSVHCGLKHGMFSLASQPQAGQGDLKLQSWSLHPWLGHSLFLHPKPPQRPSERVNLGIWYRSF